MAATKNRQNKRRRKRLAQQRQTCESKVRYASELTAINKAVALGRDYYCCPSCGCYHLTSRP